MSWKCYNCGKDVEDISSVKCPNCGYRILIKKRTPTVKKMKTD